MQIEKHSKSIVLQSPVYLWDGRKQLVGTLSLTLKHLTFELDDFQKSHLKLVIRLRDIETVESLLLFDFARNGLKIKSNSGLDLFILDDPMKFRKVLLKAIANLNSA